MVYYRAKGEFRDCFTGNTTVPGELLTKNERNTKFRFLPDHDFERVMCSRKGTYFSFGARKAYTDAVVIKL